MLVRSVRGSPSARLRISGLDPGDRESSGRMRDILHLWPGPSRESECRLFGDYQYRYGGDVAFNRLPENSISLAAGRIAYIVEYDRGSHLWISGKRDDVSFCFEIDSWRK